MKILILCLTIPVFFMLSCSSGNKCKSDHLNKMDAISIQNLLNAEKEKPDDVLDIMILLESEPNIKSIEKLEQNGIAIITAVNKIIAARAKPDAIRKILHFDDVISIEIKKDISL